MRAAALIALVALAGCSGAMARPTSRLEKSADWKRVVMPDDLGRLRSWREAFVKALAQAKTSGNGDAILREGALLDPDAAIEPVALPAGTFRCRVIKLGANGPGMQSFTPYPAFDCRVNNEGEVASFAKMTGSQRPMGLVFDDGPARKIFLGTMMLGDERRPFDYGIDPSRDVAGAIQRIGPQRWRLILPYPRFESVMDVVELVPAG